MTRDSASGRSFVSFGGMQRGPFPGKNHEAAQFAGKTVRVIGSDNGWQPKGSFTSGSRRTGKKELWAGAGAAAEGRLARSRLASWRGAFYGRGSVPSKVTGATKPFV